MSPRTHLLLWLCVTTSSLLAGCGASETPSPKPAPPPPKAEAPAPKAEDPLKRLAGEAFVFGYPLVLMDVTREAQTAKAPVNTFHHRRALADASSTDLRANADVLFSTAWLDLSKEPLILSVPDTRGRYYVLPLIDAWTNVFSSPGKRQTGTAKIDFAIVGPRWKGTLPEGVSEIKAPTEMVWVVGRMEVGGKADIAAVAKLQDQFRLTPMSQWGKRGAKPAPAPSSSTAGVDSGAGAAERVAAMDAQTFLSRLAMLLAGNPPTPPDPAIEAKLKQLGIVPGQAFEIGKLDAASQAAVQEGVKSAKDAIATAARGSLGDLRNGWTIHWDLGRYGTNYGLRAVMASLNLGANAPEDALFASTRFDGGGRPLNGANRYVLRFPKNGKAPTDAFWSLSMYDDKHRFVGNPLGRHNIGDRDKPQENADGSMEIYIQHDNPGKEKESNWLPAPKGDFHLMMRVYWPRQEMLDRRWTPPAVARAQ